MPFGARSGITPSRLIYKRDLGQQNMAAELDAIDAKILDLIQRDAALSVAEIRSAAHFASAGRSIFELCRGSTGNRG